MLFLFFLKYEPKTEIDKATFSELACNNWFFPNHGQNRILYKGDKGVKHIITKHLKTICEWEKYSIFIILKKNE